MPMWLREAVWRLCACLRNLIRTHGPPVHVRRSTVDDMGDWSFPARDPPDLDVDAAGSEHESDHIDWSGRSAASPRHGEDTRHARDGSVPGLQPSDPSRARRRTRVSLSGRGSVRPDGFPAGDVWVLAPIGRGA